jgi:hypothetical protein
MPLRLRSKIRKNACSSATFSQIATDCQASTNDSRVNVYDQGYIGLDVAELPSVPEVVQRGLPGRKAAGVGAEGELVLHGMKYLPTIMRATPTKKSRQHAMILLLRLLNMAGRPPGDGSGTRQIGHQECRTWCLKCSQGIADMSGGTHHTDPYPFEEVAKP